MFELGDRIRILALPADKESFMTLQMRRAYRKIIARKRSVRICKIDTNGTAWYKVKLWNKKGFVECHLLAVYTSDNNWRKVK